MNYEYQSSLYLPEQARPRPEVCLLNSHQSEHDGTGQGDIKFTSALPLAGIYPPRPLIPSFAPGPPDDVRIIYIVGFRLLSAFTYGLFRPGTSFGRLLRVYVPSIPSSPSCIHISTSLSI